MKKFNKLFVNYVFLVCLMVISNDLFAQQTPTCGFDQIHQQKMLDPVYRQMWEQHNQMIYSYLNSPPPKSGGIDTIPVVVHVLHLGTAVGVGANISDAQILSAIQNLNDTWANVTTPGQSIDMGVRFVMAKRDPNCNATNGIVRVNASGVAGYSADGVKRSGSVGADQNTLQDLSKWPTDKYMNFWIVTEINGNNGGCGIQGYAYLPVGIDQYNGAIMMAGTFGYDPNNTQGYYFGACGGDNSTVVHEVGHFLDLYHPFEDGDVGLCPPAENATTCATQGDFCCDTPPIMNYLGYNNNTEYFACSTTGTNTCTNQPIGNVIHNYMNYTSCPDRFTNDQKARVQACMNTSRASLKTSLGAVAPTGTFTPPIAACTSITTGQGLTGGYAGITEVIFNNLANVSSSTNNDNPTNGYMDFSTSCLNVANAQVGQTYPLKITTWFNTQIVKAWIDYNNNGSFADAGEEVTPAGGLTSTNGAQVTQNVTIPPSPTLNTYLRMRIISDMNGVNGPCHTSTYGQTEDYAVYITSNITVLDCDFSANNTTSCANSSVTFTSTTISGTPTSWNWTVTPSSGVTYTGGTSATSQNPQMIFANSGTYTISMIASDGVTPETTTKTNYITINANPTATESITNPTCGTNGNVTYVASNGVAPYVLTFNSTVQPGMTVSNLGAGSFAYSIADANSCVVTGTSILTSSGGPTVTVAGTNATCGQNNGIGTLTITGNTGTPTITWSSGGSALVENNLAAGTYTVTVLVDGCTFNLNLTISSGTGPQLTVSSTNATCGNLGTATATISGNVGPPTYVWSNGGSTSNITNLIAGTYTINVTVDGCSLNNQVVISSTNPTLSLNAVQPSCGQNNGSIAATVSGNTGTPTYLWSNSATTANISNLAAGNYTLTVTVDGCTLTDNTTLSSSSASSTLTLNSIQPSCGNSNGSITAIVSGNTGTPTYSWNNGGSTATISNLASGTYTVTVSVDGCTLTDNSTLSGTNPVLTIVATQPTCGLSNGSATATIAGNSGSSTFLWSNSATSTTISSLAAGSYQVIVNVDGCVLNGSTTLTNNQATIALTTTDPICGGSDGVITATISGNTGTPSYLWSNSQTANSISNLSPGTYSLTVNVDGCVYNTDTVLLDNSSKAGVLHNSNWVCLNSDHDLYLSNNQGNVLNWYQSFDNTNYNPIGVTAINYTYTVSNTITAFYVIVQKGTCPPDTSNVIHIHTFTQPSVNAPEVIEVMAGQTFPITATASNGTYTWSPDSAFNSSTNTLTSSVNVEQSMYVYITVVDGNGCINQDSTILYVIDSLIHDLKIPSGFSPNGDGFNERLEFFNTVGIDKFSFVLFDRWGEVIYKTEDSGNKWDGTYKGQKVISGVYTYNVTYKYISGKTGKLSGYIEIIN
ncbi:MAG: gliding motility-associated C-terminal domain-containing protein [Flavobacteriia bacterium]|nr:gliding motility-associated C-terminal domain-containing protein [Flavobacteriia bacterium]